MCGEHLSGTKRIPCHTGSSPRVRGTHDHGAHEGLQRRFIPACAGNTTNHAVWAPLRMVHPRVCGEHGAGNPAKVVFGGSSPRVRGTLVEAGFARYDDRFIPACAGNTSWASTTTTAAPVHPRVCGEHQPGRQASDGVGRFIPACAGNTLVRRARRRSRSVHPRVCGEHPPCRRGDAAAPRFIPACAGNTVSAAFVCG